MDLQSLPQKLIDEYPADLGSYLPSLDLLGMQNMFCYDYRTQPKPLMSLLPAGVWKISVFLSANHANSTLLYLAHLS
jgi:hypothetical protein